MSRPQQPWSGYAAQLLAALVLALAWGRLCQGLLTLAPSDDPADDLEAGGGFGATVFIYLPGLVLTIALVGVVLVALSPRPASALALVGAAQVVVAFTAWILVLDATSSHALTNYFPGLATHLWQTIALAVLSAGPAAMSIIVRFRQTQPSARPRRPGSGG